MMKYFASLDEAAVAANSLNWMRGSKAQGLIDLVQLGLPVPRGVIGNSQHLLAEAWDGRHLSEQGVLELQEVCALLETQAGRGLGNMSAELPLLLAIRCGDKNVEARLPETLVNLGWQPNGTTDFHTRLGIDRNFQLEHVLTTLGEPPEVLEALKAASPFEQVCQAVELLLSGLSRLPGLMDHSILLQRMVYGSYN